MKFLLYIAILVAFAGVGYLLVMPARGVNEARLECLNKRKLAETGNDADKKSAESYCKGVDQLPAK